MSILRDLGVPIFKAGGMPTIDPRHYELSVGESLHRAMKGSILHIIEKSGHIPMWETPEEANRAILSFLRQAT